MNCTLAGCSDAQKEIGGVQHHGQDARLGTLARFARHAVRATGRLVEGVADLERLGDFSDSRQEKQIPYASFRPASIQNLQGRGEAGAGLQGIPVRGRPVAISSARAGLLSIAQPRNGPSGAQLAKKGARERRRDKRLADGGRWDLACHRESSHEFVHADQFGARNLDRAILRLCSCDIVYMALNPDEVSRWSVAEIDYL
jgi:hypothetical protein